MDDDLIYRSSMIEALCRSFLLNPNAVSAVRAHLILLEGSRILPYMMWLQEYSLHIGTPSVLLFSTSGHGTLHPVYLYDLEAMDKEAFCENCLYADDIWLKLMQLSSDIPLVVSEKYAGQHMIPGSQETSCTLFRFNKTMNDEQLMRSIAWKEAA